MTTSELVRTLDRKYSGEGKITCPNEGQKVQYAPKSVTDYHGAMSVHASGAYLICGVCGTKMPTAVN